MFCTVITGVPFSAPRGAITYQASQILGFVGGAAVVAILDPRKTLGIDAATFGMSGLIVLIGVRARPTLGA